MTPYQKYSQACENNFRVFKIGTPGNGGNIIRLSAKLRRRLNYWSGQALRYARRINRQNKAHSMNHRFAAYRRQMAIWATTHCQPINHQDTKTLCN